jgi:hypothetical protein
VVYPGAKANIPLVGAGVPSRTLQIGEPRGPVSDPPSILTHR